MKPIVGKWVRNAVTGKTYRLTLVGDRMVVMESEDGSNQILSTIGNFDHYYENVGGVSVHNVQMPMGKIRSV